MTDTNNTVSDILAPYETNVKALAHEHAPSADGSYPVCPMCMESTPLAIEQARDVPKANEVQAVIDAAEAEIDAIGEDTSWVLGELTDLYVDAFFAACADATECEVCIDAARGADHDCGHTRIGEDCPVQAGED